MFNATIGIKGRPPIAIYHLLYVESDGGRRNVSISMIDIANSTGHTERACQRAVQSLIQANLVKCLRGGGRNNTNTYTLSTRRTTSDTITPSSDSIVKAVQADLDARSAKGIKKYGTTVAGNPGDLRYWLQHAYEEGLDQLLYLKRAMQEIDRA